jgi:hypothetical protein
LAPVLVGPPFDDVRLDRLSITEFPNEFFETETINRRSRSPRFEQFAISGSPPAQHRHQPKNERTIIIFLQVDIEITLADVL